MSHNRRSKSRSSLFNFRQLWQRRSQARRDMRRSIGTSFEPLEPRLALTITSPLPGPTDHIHPVLQIYLEGQQVVLPTDIGSTTSGHLNPHTHDLTGTLHIGEGGPAGIGTTVRNVTLQDFFDVWRTNGGPSGNNANAIFDTDLADGTNQPRIMGVTVNPTTQVLRMYVKESGDSAPELEYDSSSSSNNLARPELYVPRDGDQVIISLDKIANAANSPSFQPIASQTVLGGAPSVLGIDGFDPSGGPLTYTVQVSNPSLLTATLQPTSNKSVVLNVADFGQMTFQLFDNMTPNTAAHFETIVNNGEYNNSTSTPVEFYRIAYLSAGSPFVIQGGRQGVPSSLGKFDDEFNTDLQFTNPGLLAMAKSSDDTNDAEIFVTGGPARFLDMQHSIFGVLTDGDEVRQAIQNTRSSGDGPPPTDVVITSAQVVNDTQNAALMLKAAEGASGTSTVTLTVSDQQGHTFSQTFNVTVSPDTANSAPFLNPIAPITGVQDQPITVQLSATDVEGNPNFFDATKPSTETVNYTVSTDHTTGLVTITPPAGFVGTFKVQMGVRGQSQTTTADQFDTQLVTVTVAAGAPTVNLASSSDSGPSDSDNITNASSLAFDITGVTAGATVKLLKGTTVLAQGTVATGANSITLTVADPGTALGQGISAITATQTSGGQTSPASTALSVTYDTSAPSFTSTAPTTAQVGFDLAYNAQTNEEGTGVVYTLATGAPTGATINSSTGVVSFTPSSATPSTQTFSIVATDTAGNSTTQQVSLTVSNPIVDLTLTLTKPDGSPLTSLAAGQDFVLHFFARDTRTPARGVFAAYTDITFDGTKATITGPLTYSSNYGGGQSGNTSTAGLVDEAGAFAGTSELGGGAKEVFSIPMRATASGALTFTLDPADTSPQNDVLVYGQTGQVPDAQVHYGSASITVGNTFNAVNDTFTVNEDTQNNTIDPLANDASLGGATNTLTITAVGTTSNGGTVTIAQNSTRLSYTPAANFTGTETFTYTARNQNGEEHIATVTMTVSDVNDPPVATNDTFSATKNSTGNVLNVLANDTDGVDSGETLRVTAVGTGSKGGTITIGTNGANVVYTPAANATGAETFTYTISDRATGGLTATATVTVNLSGLTATPDTATVNEDAAATTIDVLANDALDPQIGGTLSITAVGTTDHGGTVSITQSGTRISYTPAANFQGTEKFTYTMTDGQGNNATSTVTVTVNNVNDPPVATNDTLTAFKNTTTTFDLLANDTSGVDPTENLVIDSVTQPSSGTVTIVENGKKVSYVPASGFSGTTSFTYTIKDPSGATATATANITVQDFAPSQLAGFVYFDVNNNGVKDAGEIGIAGVTITLAGTASAGSNTAVNQTAKTADDGSYKFENMAPGSYTLTQSQPLFVIDGKETAGSQGATVANNKLTITLAQGVTGANNNFGELGRTPQTITLRDFFSSTSRNYAHAAFDSSGNELWHSLSGAPWQANTGTSFSLSGNKSQITYTGTNGNSQVVSKAIDADDLPVYQSGQSSSNSLYYIPANSGTIPSGSNQSPTAANDSYSTPVGTALTVTAANGVLKNDTDPENNALTAAVVTQPAHGTLSLSANGSFVFTPTAGFTGTDTFTYRASDGNSNSNTATVTINIGTNGAPTAVADAYTATEDTALTVTAANGVLKNDTDPENNALTAVINTQPTKGTLSLAADGSFTYTPNANATGTDTFTYKASDGTNQSAAATVTITITAVNDAPIAVNDNFSTTKNTPLSQTAPGVLINDTDPEGASLTVTVAPNGNPTHGTLSLNPNGSFLYTPATDFTGTDTFTYRVSDGTLTADAVATIAINPPTNQAPVANNDTYTTDEDTPLTVTTANSVLSNDTDAENNSLTAILGTGPTHGTFSLNANGTFTYTPAANFNGVDSFTYRANDGNSSSPLATVTINVTAVNDLPVGVADEYQTDPGVSLTVPTGTGVLSNDTDADTQALTAVKLTDPANGTLTLNSNGSFTYTPNNGFVGTDTFTYKAVDPQNGESAATTVTIHVNSPPTAADDLYQATEDTPLVVNAADGVLDNDTDPTNDTLTAEVVQQPQHGTLTLNANGSFTYVPAANFSGTDTFTYRASDGDTTSQPATVTINVQAANDAPVAANDSYNVNTGATLTVFAAQGVLSNDTDADNDTLSAIKVTDPAHGTVTLLADGSFSYTPTAGFSGDDSFTYRAEDGHGGSATATVSIHVNAIPAAVNDAYTATEDVELVVTVDQGVIDNDTDADNGTLTATIVTQPQHGTLTLNSNGSFTYTPSANFNGTDGFSYTVSDGLATSNAAAVTITIDPVNDAPVRTSNAPAALNVNEDSAASTAASLGLASLAYSPGGGSDEASQTLTFEITSIPSFISLFQADGTTAVTANSTLTLAELQGLKYKTVADSFGAGSITWSVQDSGGTANGGVDTLNQTLSVAVNSVNDAPERTAGDPAAIRVATDSANTTAVTLGLAALDYGPGGGSAEATQTLAYEVTSIPAFVTLFKADGTTAVTANTTLTLAELRGLMYKTVAGATGAGSITWTVQDDGGTANGGVDTLSQSLSITVGDVNEAPVRTAGNPAAIDVDEDSSNTTAVALGLAGLAYGPGGAGEEASQTLTYTLTNIPAFISVFQADGTTAVAANDTLTLAELQGLTYKTVANASGTANLTWSVQDDGGTANGGLDTLLETLSVTVLAVNDAPELTAASPAAINVEEDSANTTAASLGLTALTYGPGGGTDESSQTLTYTITAIPDFISLVKDDGIAVVTVNSTLTLGELQGLKYKTLANASGTGDLAWSVTDSGGTANGGVDSLSQTLSITVSEINDAPARTAGDAAAITVVEDSATGTAVSLGLTSLEYGPGGGAAEAGQTLTYTLTAIPSFITVVMADGTTAVAVNDTLTLAELQGLKYKTLANASGTGDLTWSVQDNGGTASGGLDTLSETLAVTVTAENDAPARTAGSPVAIDVDEDSANATAVSLGFAGLDYGPGGGSDESTQTLTYAVTSIPGFIAIFKADGTTAVTANEELTLAELQGLTYKTVADSWGAANLLWTVKDSGGGTGGNVDTLTETLAINVASINDAPELLAGAPAAITADEDSANTTAVSLGLGGLDYGPGGGTAEDTQSLTYKLTSIPAFITVFQADGTTAVVVDTALSLAELRGLTYTTVPDASGASTIVWSVQDDGGTDNGGVDTLAQTLSITINPANDAPTGQADSYNTDQDVTLVVDAAGGVLDNDDDVDGDSLTAELVTDVASGTLNLASDGSFTYTPATGFTGPVTFTYIAKDATTQSDPITVTITVDAPGGEGEGFSATDAALLAYLGDNSGGDTSANWQDAVDEALGELG